MELPLFGVDAFTSRPFSGNPAAVCLLDAERPAEWMQALAAEMNLAETAFVLRDGDGWRLRWFTPRVEVDLCGHATLASAHVLWETQALAPTEPVKFQTQSGRLTCTRRDPWIEMDFPSEPANQATEETGFLEALRVPGRVIGRKRNRMDYLVEVESERAVREVRPNLELLATLPVRGLILTARSESWEYDFVSRFFAPAMGIDEDPVTGSAHCALGPYWAEKLGKSELIGYQVSRRGGMVRVAVGGDRVILGGQAVTVYRASLCA